MAREIIPNPDPSVLTTAQLLREVQIMRAYVDSEVMHLKEIMVQHDKMTSLAIEKSEVSYNERFAKTNEFREQQNDLIQTFAKGDETRNSIRGLDDKFEANIKTVSERFEQNVQNVTDRYEKGHATLVDKINVVQNHLSEKIVSTVSVQENKFFATDKQMQTLIDANAEISNRGLTELNKWKENTSGSIRVILAVGGFIVALVLALVIAFFKTVIN